MKEKTETAGRAGGLARADALDAKTRSKIAKAAAQARWSGEIVRATHGSADHPLKFGDTEIQCYVVEGDRRVIVQRAMQTGIGMSTSGGSGGAHRLAQFIEGLAEKGIDCSDLAVRIRNPILFRPPGSGKPAYGYEATILADVCDAVLAAREKDVLLPQQAHIAAQCEILVRGFARVGIIALVDEATGFQKDRARDALAKILEAFVAKELQPWVKTFPSDFYEQMFRLRGLPYPNQSVRRPQYFGHLTNDVIYRRLAPKVWEEIKSQQEKDKHEGKKTGRLHQRLTPDMGHPKLRDLLTSVTTVMKLSDRWDDFKSKLDRVHPPYNDTIPLPLDMQQDDGKGI